MSENKKKIFIIISILVGLAIAVILFLLFRSKSSNVGNLDNNLPPESLSGEAADNTPATLTDLNGNQKLTPKIPPAELYPEQMAKIFVERLFSYSNQNNNQHITDMLSWATSDMAKWMEKQRVEFSNDYQGVNTVVISSSVKEIKDKTAVIEIGIRQTFEGVKNEVVYKTGRVELINDGKNWKVDGLYWDK